MAEGPCQSAKAAQSVCQVPGCGKSLVEEKRFYSKRSVCPAHACASSVTVNGVVSRFCQQCTRFHGLKEFSGDRRSCDIKLQQRSEAKRLARLTKRQLREAANAVNAAGSTANGAMEQDLNPDPDADADVDGDADADADGEGDAADEDMEPAVAVPGAAAAGSRAKPASNATAEREHAGASLNRRQQPQLRQAAHSNCAAGGSSAEPHAAQHTHLSAAGGMGSGPAQRRAAASDTGGEQQPSDARNSGSLLGKRRECDKDLMELIIIGNGSNSQSHASGPNSLAGASAADSAACEPAEARKAPAPPAPPLRRAATACSSLGLGLAAPAVPSSCAGSGGAAALQAIGMDLDESPSLQQQQQQQQQAPGGRANRPRPSRSSTSRLCIALPPRSPNQLSADGAGAAAGDGPPLVPLPPAPASSQDSGSLLDLLFQGGQLMAAMGSAAGSSAAQRQQQHLGAAPWPQPAPAGSMPSLRPGRGALKRQSSAALTYRGGPSPPQGGGTLQPPQPLQCQLSSSLSGSQMLEGPSRMSSLSRSLSISQSQSQLGHATQAHSQPRPPHVSRAPLADPTRLLDSDDEIEPMYLDMLAFGSDGSWAVSSTSKVDSWHGGLAATADRTSAAAVSAPPRALDAAPAAPAAAAGPVLVPLTLPAASGQASALQQVRPQEEEQGQGRALSFANAWLAGGRGGVGGGGGPQLPQHRLDAAPPMDTLQHLLAGGGNPAAGGAGISNSNGGSGGAFGAQTNSPFVTSGFGLRGDARVQDIASSIAMDWRAQQQEQQQRRLLAASLQQAQGQAQGWGDPGQASAPASLWLQHQGSSDGLLGGSGSMWQANDMEVQEVLDQLTGGGGGDRPAPLVPLSTQQQHHHQAMANVHSAPLPGIAGLPQQLGMGMGVPGQRPPSKGGMRRLAMAEYANSLGIGSGSDLGSGGMMPDGSGGGGGGGGFDALAAYAQAQGALGAAPQRRPEIVDALQRLAFG